MSRTKALLLVLAALLAGWLAVAPRSIAADEEGPVPAASATPEGEPSAPDAALPATGPVPETAPGTAQASSAGAETPRSPDLARVRDAVAAYRRGDLAAGDALRAAVGSPGAGALLDWAALRFGGSAVPFERVLAFATEHPDFPGRPWLRRRAEEALLAEHKPAAVVRAFFSRDRPQTPSGTLALAQALRADGLTGDAAGLIREVWRHETFGRETEARMLDAFPDALAPADHRFRMERLLLKENWAAARRAAGYAGAAYEALVKARAAVDSRAANAGKLVEAVPAGLKGDSSFLFSRAQLLRRTGKNQEAGKVLADATRDPALLADGDAWWTERRLVARNLLDAGDAKAAYAVVAGHGAVSAERRIEAEFMAGWIALRFLHETGAARRHFDRAGTMAGTPISLARARYWQGRAAEGAGAAEEAKRFYAEAARYGTTYYGQLAAARLGWPEVTLRPPGDPAGAARRAAARLPCVEAVGMAYEAGLRELALPLAVEFGRNATDVAAIEQVADIALRNGDPRALLTVGKLASQRGLPLDEAAFPISGIPAFEPVGRPAERAMIHAIARQESAFDPAAGSGAGARGLMQLMPATAAMTARKAGIAYEPGRLLEASYNAQLGAAHLGDLMEDWRGSYILVFASYNAGPGNVRKWIAAAGDPREPGVDAVDWVERIPFSETRNYVQRVMENLQVYRKRLDQRSALLIESDLKRGGLPTLPASP